MKETEDLREKKINIECFLSCEESRFKIVCVNDESRRRTIGGGKGKRW